MKTVVGVCIRWSSSYVEIKIRFCTTGKEKYPDKEGVNFFIQPKVLASRILSHEM